MFDIVKSLAYTNEKKVCHACMALYGKQDDFIDITECEEYYVSVSFEGKKVPDFFINNWVVCEISCDTSSK